MKLKLLIVAVLVVVGLWFLKSRLDEKKEYIPGVPAVAESGSATGKPAANAPRQKFTVGFLPVT